MTETHDQQAHTRRGHRRRIRRHAGGQPSAVARRRRHHLGQPAAKFVERIRLHQLVAGNQQATADYGSLLGEGIQLVVDSASRINTTAQTVEFASGRRPVHYDYVIYAVGSTGAAPASIPGAAEFAYPIGEFEYASGCATASTSCTPTHR